MIKILSNNNCSRCSMIRTLFKNRGIDFEYILLENLSEKEKKNYITQARKKGLMNMPIVVKDDKVIDFKEVM